MITHIEMNKEMRSGVFGEIGDELNLSFMHVFFALSAWSHGKNFVV